MDATNPSSAAAPRSSAARLPAALLPRLLADLLGDGLEVEFEVTGSSMSPFVRNLDLVTLVPCGRRRVGVGDVVARLHGERLLVHRVVALDENGVVTRGDAAPGADPPAVWQDVLGIVVGIERRGRPVRCGLGPERTVIAWLLHHGWLVPGLGPWRWLLRKG